MKRMMVANDLPGIGKVALALQLPVFAACQIETAILPTVLLSSHTGGFPGVVLADQSALLADFLNQWQQLELPVDACLVGYCRTKEVLSSLAEATKERAVPLIVDPIMGDNGALYQGFDADYVQAMKELVGQAVVIIPNLMEAALLTDTPFLETGYGKEQIADLLVQLAQLGPKEIVLTGVSFEEKTVGLAYYQAETQQVRYVMGQQFPEHFFGTGDLVSALVSAAYVEGISLEQTCQAIVPFLETVLASTLAAKREQKYGLVIEPHLADLPQLFFNVKGECDEQ